MAIENDMKEKHGNDQATESFWNWRERLHPSPSSHPVSSRKKGLIPICLLLLIFFFVRYGLKHENASWVPLGLAGIFALITLLIPAWLIKIERGGQVFGMWVGTFFTYLTLLPFYFLIIFPMRLALALMGKDPMMRKLERHAKTYWIDYSAKSTPQHLERQF